MHMDFRLVPKSATLNDREWRNGHAVCVISPNSIAFVDYYVKVVEYTVTTRGFCVLLHEGARGSA